MAKVDLNKERCIGCGACMSIAPDNFTFGDDGRAEMINPELTDAAIEASEMCPVSAIIIENCGCNSCHYNEEKECNCDNECSCNNECNCENECNCNNECKCSDECNCGRK